LKWRDEMKGLNWTAQLFLGIFLSVILIFGLLKTFEWSSTAFLSEIKPTIVETKFVTRTEYVGINQTEPMEMTVTGYTAGPESTGKRPGMKGYGITYTGTKARPGVCAVDPSHIPLGTSLYVEGYGMCHAEDTGGKVDGWHVDVFVDKVSDAMVFDPKVKRKVWILKDFGEGPA
jgi:3D (Asp-Asp-Asp) domain-containing protein